MLVWSALAAMPAMAKPAEIELQSADAAQVRGRQMFAYDQAAWHGTDAFRADIARAGLDLQGLAAERGLAGYIVEPGEGGELLTTFYGDQGGSLQALARYRVVGGKVVGGGLLGLDADSGLSPLAVRMIGARQLALATMAVGDHGLCSPDRPNTLILPPDAAGVISAYVLTSNTQAGVYPAGGHYRFDIGADGKLAGERRFMNACFPLDFRPNRKGDRPDAIFLTHLLDPQPTEIHVFVSLNIPVALGVITVANKAVWMVSRGSVAHAGDAPAK